MPRLKRPSSPKPESRIMSEQFECERLARYLTERDYKFSHLPLGQFTKSWSVKRKNAAAGVNGGVPDYLLILKCNKIAFLEMKRVKGGRVSPEQTSWLEALRGVGAFAAVAKGYDEAVSLIEGWENGYNLPFLLKARYE